MNEDLIREARELAKFGADLNPQEANRVLSELADALEAATGEPEWEYGHAHVKYLQAATPTRTRDEAEHIVTRWNRFVEPPTGVLARRRKAGPWVPVDGNEK